MTRVKNITASDAFAMTKKGAIFVDVREKGEIERKAFDVPDIMVVPLSRFESGFGEIPKNRRVIVVCRSGNRSATAAAMLMNWGYRNVANLQHGIIGWEREGLAIKVKPKRNIFSLLVRMFRKES